MIYDSMKERESLENKYEYRNNYLSCVDRIYCVPVFWLGKLGKSSTLQ